MTSAVAPAEATERLQPRWIHGALTDSVLALCWVPFAIVALAFDGRPDATKALMSAVLLFSFTHQPLTLALVYGDHERFSLRRRIFTWSPLVFAVAVLVALEVSFVLLAIVGGLWNAVHTLFQRYGIVRIYGRKVGQGDGRLERALLLSWLIGVLLWAAADTRTPDRAVEAGLGGHNRDAVEILAELRPVALVLLVPVVIAALALSVRWVAREMGLGSGSNPAKHLYLGSTAALFVLTVVNPIAGLIAYVGSHAAEYFIIVYTNLRTRYQVDPTDAALVGRAVRSPVGRPGFMLLYVGAIVAIVYGLAEAGSSRAYAMVFFVLGGLHVFYDGFIWKLRGAKVARSFGVPTADTV